MVTTPRFDIPAFLDADVFTVLHAWKCIHNRFVIDRTAFITSNEARTYALRARELVSIIRYCCVLHSLSHILCKVKYVVSNDMSGNRIVFAVRQDHSGGYQVSVRCQTA